MDAITYNSSFDTEDEDFSESEKQTNGSKDNQDSKSKVEIENSSLCEGVRDLRLVTGQSQIESKNKWRLKKNSNSLDKSKLNESYGKSSQKDQFEPRHGFFEAFYRSKRSASCFRGSAAINRKKKLQEIEHNNLVSVIESD